MFPMQKTFPAQIDVLREALGWLRTFLSPFFQKKTLLKLELAAEEVFINIIKHGYLEKEGAIEIRIEVFENKVEIIFIDAAPPFNPNSLEKVDTTKNLESRDIGGLGVHLIRSSVDELIYKRAFDKNYLTLILFRGPSSQKR